MVFVLTHIGLQNFKSIKNIGLDLSKVNIFIGANRTGKSSIFQALALLKQSEDWINWDGNILNMGSFEKVLNNQADEKEILIRLKGNLQASPNVMTYTGIEELNYDITIKAGLKGLEEVRYNITGDNHSFSGVTTDDKPESDIYYHDIGEFKYQIRTTLSVLNKPDVLQATSPFEKRVLNQKICNALIEVLYVFKNQLDKCFFIPASRGFDKAFYNLISSYSPNSVGSQGTTAQAEAAASGIASKHSIERKVSNLIKRIYPGVEVHSNIENETVEVITTDQTGNEYNILKEGFGINQLIFLFYLVATTDKGSTLLIEEPEISLHPKLQNTLTSILVETALNENKQLLLTTHSEHILLGVLDAITEGKLTPEDVTIYHFERKNDNASTNVTRLKVDNDGQIEGGLKGFFDADMYHINKFFENISKSSR